MAFVFMARNANIPVLSVNYKQGDKPLFYVSFWRALDMLREEDINGAKIYKDVTQRVHGKGRPMPILQFQRPVREEHDSPCTISFAEMEAVAGVRGSEGVQRRARDKFHAWAHPDSNGHVCGDTLAVRVCPAG